MVLQTHALPLGYVAIMTPTRIELVLPPWKGDVLTAWPRSLIYFAESLSDIDNFSIDIYKYQVLFLISFIFCNFTVPVRIKHTFYKKQKRPAVFTAGQLPELGSNQQPFG